MTASLLTLPRGASSRIGTTIAWNLFLRPELNRYLVHFKTPTDMTLLSLTQAARELGLSFSTIYSWHSRGYIPSVPVGENRVAITSNTFRRLRAVLEAEGQAGVRDGLVA